MAGGKKSGNRGSKIISCKGIRSKCISTFQDKKYGRDRRVHNGTTSGWRCTVCKNETSAW